MIVRIKTLLNAALPLTPFILIEWKLIDRYTFAFLCCTFILIYHSMKYGFSKAILEVHHRSSHQLAAAFIQLSYLTAAVDVRFIHISDNIPSRVRYHSIVLYAVLVALRILLTNMLLVNTNAFKTICNRTSPPSRYRIISAIRFLAYLICNKHLTVSMIHLCSAAILISGQMALNSRVSVIAIIPAALINLNNMINKGSLSRSNLVKS